MNRNVFRLVFNAERDVWVPVAENVRGRGKKSSRRRLASVALGLALAGAGSAQAGPSVPAPNALPMPSSGARPFIFSGSVVGGQPSVVGNAMTINTPSRTLGLNWDRFDIGSDASVTFNQPDASSRVLNRIWSADPSVIMGRLNANGEVYLINQNGILFGNGAQVNVGGLVASALNLSEGMLNKLLNSGLPTARGDRLEFAWDGTVAAFNLGFITVDAGARIGTPAGGRVVLLAPRTVENLGLIEGGAGAEAILAAGGKVVLTVPDDPSLRGLLVETQAFSGKDVSGNTVSLDGSAINSGRIDTGNGGVVSLAALAVNQKGIVNATKAVNLNGTTMLVSGTIETDRLTINQRGAKAEIDWVSGFNVGAGKTVEFVQPSTGSVVYNYVYDPDRTAVDGSILNVAGRSGIDGILRATGQFFLINERGIRFGAKADVQAANFVASALGVSPKLVRDGIFAMDYVDSSLGGTRSFYLSKNQFTADLETDYAGASDSARATFAAATVDVENGAKISTSIDNGFVMLIGGTVNQGGSIATPTGQTLLAAGADVYLKPPFSAGLRGFMAEVNPLYVVRKWDDSKWGVVEHGTINNSGAIAAALGNISLVGYNINQLGSLWTSTSVTSNGSISLVARDQVGNSTLPAIDGEPAVFSEKRYINSKGVTTASTTDGESNEQSVFIVGQNGGNLVFGANSVTEVALNGSSKKTISAEQSFIESSIDSIAKQIIIAGNGSAGAQLIAHSGQIRFMASDTFDLTRGFINDPVNPSQNATPISEVGIFVGDGAKLDVSGVTAKKSVRDLFIEVELRGDEFANNTVQRNSKLRGEKAWVDIRDDVEIADMSGWFGKVGKTVEEKAADGGEISLRTTGSVIVKGNAELNVSGGGVAYEGDTITESRVLSIGGKSYRLNDAPASSIYTGIKNRQRKLADYYEGRSAGKVELLGNSLAVDGKLIANTTRGTGQRNIGDPETDHYAAPLGGKLIIQDAGQHFPLVDRDNATEEERIRAYSEAQIAFVKGAANAAAGLKAGDSAGKRLELSQSLVDAGFSRFDIKSDGRIEVGSDIELNLAPGGEFKAAGRQVYVAGKIKAPNGKISLTTRDMSAAAGLFPTLFDAKFSTLIIDNGASLSTAGQWVNDYLDRKENSRKVEAIDGGMISLVSAYDVDLRAGSELNVSGGVLVSKKGKIEAGDAGSIALTTGGMGSAGGFDFTTDGDRRDASLFLDGALSAYALGSGGALEINTSAVRIGEHFATDSRDWSRIKRLAEDQVGVALTADFFNSGGFYDFKLVGRDGLAVLDGTRIAAQPINWSLEGLPTYRRKASGSELASFARSVVLHADLRSSATDLTLVTRSLNYGDLLVGEGAYLGVSPQGSINLESAGQLTVLGTLEAPVGSIKLSRPANPISNQYNVVESFGYSEAKQSESIYLGPNSRLLAAGTVVLSAAARRALASGVTAESLLDQQRYKGKLLSGGKVDIDAGMGYLVTAQGSTIDVSGALDSLNAASATTSGGLTYAAKTLGSAGGQVSLAAQEGMLLDGSYAAEGKHGALGGIFSLSLYKRSSSESWYATDESNLPATIKGARQLTLIQSSGSRPLQWQLNADETQAYLNGTQALASADYNGKATVDVASLNSAGFGSWYLSSQDQIRFDGKISATVNNQLRLNAPKFTAADDATRVALVAAAIQLGNYAPAAAPVATADTGLAEASFTARDIGLSGNFTWNGFALTQLNSSGEIHFDSTANIVPNADPTLPGTPYFRGQMTAAGAVVFSAARLSPSTYSDYRVDLTSDSASRIEINRSVGSSAAESLAAAGRIEFAAQDILHSGTVTAPLGEIVFSAPGGSVTLSENSVTSVAADQTMLFGQTNQSGRYWQFKSSYWNPQTKTLDSTTYNVEKAPEKAIRIDAADSIVKAGAQLDLSGGGEAIASEFTPGPGGKTNILAASASAGMTTFAVLPSWSGAVAPQDSQAMAYYNVSSPTKVVNGDAVDYQYDSTPTLKAGDQIQLAANGSGLAAGTYTLLPASYAQLPGAYLVSVKSTNERVVARSRGMSDGGWLVNGSIMASNADGSSSAYTQSAMTFEVANPSLVSARATYQVSKLSKFFFDKAGNSLPGDAGQLTVIGRNSVAFDPTIVAMRQAEIAAEDGRKRAGEGLKLDLAAPKLLISDGALAPDATWSVVDQDKLVALGAASLLLGGVRDVQGETTNIETIATQVLVSNGGASDSAKALIGPEIMLTATEQLTVAAGSRIEAQGAASGRKVVLAGDGAFLRAADGVQANLSRTGSVTRSLGTLTLEESAVVAGRTLVFDATRLTSLDGNVLLGNVGADGSRSGGYLSIGAGRINVLADGSTPAEGLTFGNDDFARFAKADQLRLSSYSTLDLYGDATLGSGSLNELVLAAAGIAGHGGASAKASIVAKKVVFENPSSESSSFTTSGLGGGTLDVSAEQITFGNNRSTQTQRDAEETGFALRGFDNVKLTASGDVRFVGLGVTAVDNSTAFDGSGNATKLVIDAGRVTTVGAADHLLAASGLTEIKGGAAGGSATGLGGALELRGKSVDVSGRIETAAGKLTLAATGTDSSDDVKVGSAAVILAEGSQVAFADTYAYASGGEITLKSAKGNVTVDSGAVVSVSAHAEGGDAGSLALIAQEGSVSAGAGTLRGAAKAGDPELVQGSLKVDALSLALDNLADAVRQLLPDGSTRTNFGAEWNVRARAGNLTLNNEIKAQAVKLAADAGNIDIAGTIDASGSKGGKIEFYANRAAGVGGWISLLAGSKLKAYATESVGTGQGTKGQGGTVIVGVSATAAADELDTGINFAGAIADKAAASIDVSTAEGSAADKGKVTFRAPRQDTLGNLIGFDGAVIVSNDTLANVMATSYLVTPSVAVPSLSWGTVLGVRLSAANLGQATVNLGGLGSKSVLNADGSALADGTLVSTTAGKVLVFDGTDYRISPTAASAIPATPANASLTAGSYQVSGSAPTSWSLVSFKAGAASTATTKLKIGGKEYSLRQSDGKALAAGTIKKDQLVLAVFDGTSFRLSQTKPAEARVVNLATGPASGQYQVDSAKTVAPLVAGSVVTFTATSNAKAGSTLKVGNNEVKLLLNADGSPLVDASFAAEQGVVAVYDGAAFRVSTVALKDVNASANAYKVTPALKPSTEADFKMDGYSVTFRAKVANTGTGKLTIITANSAAGYAVDLKRADGTALQKGDIKTNQLMTVVYTTNAAGTGEFRIAGGTELAAAPVTDSTMASVNLAGDIKGASSVALEAVNSTRKTGDVVLGAQQQAVLLAVTAQVAAAKGATFVNAADAGGRLGVVFRPGEEVRASGDITVGNDWGFSNVRYANQPGFLALRAEGDLNINGTLSDGFTKVGSGSTAINEVSRDARLASSGDSWSYQLVAGADAGAAAPLTTKHAGTTGSITIASGKLVRTGQGSIDMAASKDIKLLDRAAVYTAGVADSTNPPGFNSFSVGGTSINSISSVFPIGGGDISLTAGERLLMEAIPPGTVEHHINEWLFRAGGNIRNLQWWPRIASFQQGVAAFGGGDIKLTAGSEIKNFAAFIPTSGRVPTVDGERQPELAKITGGGDLVVHTAGAVNGGLFYAETGHLRIDAGTLSNNVGLALGNTSARIVADGDVQLGNVFNPLWVTAGRYVTSGGSSSISNSTAEEYKVRIGTYGDRSAVSVVSLAGDVELKPSKAFFGVDDEQAHFVAPAKVSVAALNGDISGSLVQAPGTNGQLDLLAAGSIALGADSIRQLDLPASVLPSVSNPIKEGTVFSLLRLLGGAASTGHSATAWHEGDNEPSRLVTLTGDISGPDDQTAVFSEAVKVESGGDVSNLNLSVQHLAETSVSRVTAKGDISFTLDDTKSAQGFKVNGPGRLEVIAGGNVDLGTSEGIVSKGNLENPYLPTGGADIFVMAGTAAPDYSGFLTYLQEKGLATGADTTSNGLRNRFYTLLRDFGNEAENGGGEASYEKGRAAIRALFPTASFAKGNIDLFYSAVKTEQGGRIDMLAPGGGVTVGIANPSSSIVRKPAEQGLFTFRGGDIRAFVRDNFLVNQSRVFTLDGGDILVWADKGNIDAGNGAKTASATPPPVLVVRDGQIILDATNSVSGSGIGALTSRDTSPISNMYLFAPQGAIDAGDAGLRSSGNITLGAQTILNASNIQAAGSVTGAPAPVASAAPVATPTTPTNTDKGEAQAASTLASSRDAALGILTVEVIEGGEAVAEPAPTATADKKDERKKR